MTTYFDTEPRRCPYCKRDFTVYDNGPFNIGLESQCDCGFLYAKTPEQLEPCAAGHYGNYTYFEKTDGARRCTICDLKASRDKIAALKAIIAESKKARTDAEEIAAQVVAMARDEIRKATIEAFNMPFDKLINNTVSTAIDTLKERESQDNIELAHQLWDEVWKGANK